MIMLKIILIIEGVVMVCIGILNLFKGIKDIRKEMKGRKDADNRI